MFKTDISQLRQKKNVSIKVEGSILPDSPSVFFRAKQEEIYRQYETARLFLHETNRDDSAWNYWFNKVEDAELQDTFILLFKEKMLEASLMFYNVVVDLSWVLCYVSAEYLSYVDDSTIEFEKLMTIEEAYSLLRKAEENVENPDAYGNPFAYLKKMNPRFSDAVDLIVEFWKSYSQLPIRNLYNFIKHRGKPLYSEIEQKMGPKLLDLHMNGISCPTDVRDVQKSASLFDTIRQLEKFDDDVLYPYIKGLINLLEPIVDSSPYVM